MASFRTLVESMTNHERSRWAQAGYPGLRLKEEERLAAFLDTLRSTTDRAVG